MLSFFVCGIFFNDILRWIPRIILPYGMLDRTVFCNVFYQMDYMHLYE